MLEICIFLGLAKVVENCKKYQFIYLGQNLKLFPPLVKVDEAVGDDIRDGRVDHRQVGQEGAQVWYRAIAGEK